MFRSRLLLFSHLLSLSSFGGELLAPYNSHAVDALPLAAADAAKQWKLPPGFQMEVFASEPEVSQPVAMAVDARGRLWVAECYSFAEVAIKYDDALRDQILIFEDTDGDGKADSRKVFAEGLQRLSSIEIGMGGVWAITHPNLIFIPDGNADDVPDGAPVIKLDGFESQTNHHTMANGLRWGPDGWLYGRQGIQAVSAIGRPGIATKERAQTNGGIWRFHPQRNAVEVFCHGTTNPWGMDWNEYGEAFFINTVIGHLWHALPGAHYRRMHGEDIVPHVYETIEQHADHVHWDTKEPWDNWHKNGISDGTSAAGGGHAHTGLMFYSGDNWPDEWRGKLLTINFNGRRLNVEDVVRTDGSGYVGKHQPDIAFSADPWFRGIDLLYGPDGGVFIADWSDTGECHGNDGIHRSSGRIFKMTYGIPKTTVITDINLLEPTALVALLDHKNEHFARHARKRFQALAQAGTDLSDVRQALQEKLSADDSTIGKLRALWSLHASGGVPVSILYGLLGDANEHLRVWAIRLLVDDITASDRFPELPAKLAVVAESEHNAAVRLALACALQRLPNAHRAAVARPLLRCKTDANDHNLPKMLWYGIQPLAESAPAVLAELGIGCEIPHLRTCIARRLTSRGADAATAMGALLTHAARTPAVQLDVLTGIRAALEGERNAMPNSAWASADVQFRQSPDPQVRELARTLGAIFADPAALAATRLVALDASLPIEMRRDALRTSIASRIPGLRDLCVELLPVRDLTATAADGLALESDPALADLIIEHYPTLESADKNHVLSILVSRAEWASRLLTAVAEGKMQRSDISAFHARQLAGYHNQELNHQLNEVWGQFREPDTAKQNQIASWKARLTPEVLAKGDLDAGKVLFQGLCGACHVLNGLGGHLGPELTGSGRDNIDYLLSNIIDPNAAVAHAYQLVTIQMKDGRSLSGFVQSQNERILSIRTLAEEVSLLMPDVVKIEKSPLSLMPEGLLQACNETQVRDLIAYLMKK